MKEFNIEITKEEAYQQGLADGIKKFLEIQLDDLKDSLIERETYDEAVADIHDTYLLDESEKEALIFWLNERLDGLDGVKFNKEFMSIVNNELNKQIINTVSHNLDRERVRVLNILRGEQQ